MFASNRAIYSAYGPLGRETLERAVELADYDRCREEQRRAREQGRLVGVGFSTYIEPAPGPPDFFAPIGAPISGEWAVAAGGSRAAMHVLVTQSLLEMCAERVSPNCHSAA